jgi:iron complex outermembrane receptor protein
MYEQVTWTPTPESPWSYTLGSRYTKDYREVNNRIAAAADTSYGNFSPTVVINYALTNDVNLYGKVAKGYKAGGFNARQADVSEKFGPEKIVSYEAGVKSEFFDRRARLNIATFYSNYTDIQLDITAPDQPNPALTITKNAGKATISGLEAELSVAATDDLLLQLAYSYIDAQVDKVEGEDVRLYEIPNTPRHTVTASMNWHVARFTAGDVDFSGDYSWRDKSNTMARDPTYTGTGEHVHSVIGTYDLLNLRLALAGGDWVGHGLSFEVGLWVKNALDEKYYKDTFSSFNQLHADQVSTYGEPRNYGVDFKIKY